MNFFISECLSQRWAATLLRLIVIHGITEFVNFGHLRYRRRYVKSKVRDSLLALLQNLDLLN